MNKFPVIFLRRLLLFLSNRRRIGIEFSVTLIGSVMNAAFSFFSLKILSVHFSKVDYADYALSVTISALSGLFFYGPFSTACSKFLLLADTRSESDVFFDSVSSIFGKAIRLHLVVAVSLGFLFFVFGLRSSLVYALVISVLSSAYAGRLSIYENIYATRRERVPALFVSLIATACRVGVVSLAVILGSKQVFQALLFSLISIAFADFFIKRRFFSANCLYPIRSPSSEYYSHLIAHTLPVSWWTFPQWLQQSVDRWVLDFRFGPQTTAEFSILSSIFCNPLNLLASSVNQFILPILYQRFASSGEGVFRDLVARSMQAIALFIVAALPILIVSALWPNVLIGVLSDLKYLNISVFSLEMVIATLLTTIANFLMFPIMVYGDFKFLTPFKVTSSLIGLLLIGCGAYFDGVKGAVLGYLLFGLFSGVLSVLMITLFLQKLSRLGKVGKRCSISEN